ncbi:MAG: hypothetical protein ACON3Z_04755 [Bradymonadia bacterium]
MMNTLKKCRIRFLLITALLASHMMMTGCGVEPNDAAQPVVLLSGGQAQGQDMVGQQPTSQSPGFDGQSPSEGPGGQGMPNHDGGVADSAIKQGALAAIGYPGQAQQSAETIIDVALHGAYCASYMMGGQALVTSGTLTLNGPGGMVCPINGLVFSYAQSPADRLVINLANGYSAEVQVDDMRGQLVDGPDAFMDGDHRVDIIVNAPGIFGLKLVSESLGINRRMNIEGDVEINGQRFNVGLQLAGTLRFQNDSTGLQHNGEYRMSGQLSGAGIDARVDESWAYELVCSNRPFRSNGSRCASTAQRRLSNQWTHNGTTYAVTDGFTNAAFIDGKPNPSEFINGYWNAGGTLTENGAPIGEIQFRSDASGAMVGFYLALQGETVELQTWLTNVTRD